MRRRCAFRFHLLSFPKTKPRRLPGRVSGGMLAGGPGFEPGLTESESVVLPLDDPPRRGKTLDKREKLLLEPPDQALQHPRNFSCFIDESKCRTALQNTRFDTYVELSSRFRAGAFCDIQEPRKLPARPALVSFRDIRWHRYRCLEHLIPESVMLSRTERLVNIDAQ